MINLSIDHIRVTAEPGAHIDEALWDAIVLAVSNRETVILQFMDSTYTVDAKAILSHIRATREQLDDLPR